MACVCFYVTETGDIRITVEFSGQSFATIGVLISAISLSVILVFLAISETKRSCLRELNLSHGIPRKRDSKDKLKMQLSVSRSRND